MKKIKALKDFRDKFNGKLYRVGAELEWDDDRINAMNEKHPGYIEIVATIIELKRRDSTDPPLEDPPKPPARSRAKKPPASAP